MQGGIFTNYSSIAQRFVPGQPLETPILTPVPNLVFSDPNLSAFQVVTNTPGKVESLNFNSQLSNNVRQGVTFSLNIPIYSNRQVKTNVNNAKINKLSAELNMRTVKNTVRQDIETAVTSARLAQRRYQALVNQIKAQRELFRNAEQRFQVGAINAFDFNVIANNLSRLETDLIRQKYEVLLRNKVIDFYMGKDLTF
jgi:outer membrane protein